MRAALLVGILCLGPSCALFGQGPTNGPVAGAVVAEHPLAARAGLDVLEAGGNAADAAVATALALAVVLPQAGNLGGGGFALWVSGEGETQAVDFREVAPTGTDPRAYLDADALVQSDNPTRSEHYAGIVQRPRAYGGVQH